MYIHTAANLCRLSPQIKSASVSSGLSNINISSCLQDTNVFVTVSLVYHQVIGFITAAYLTIFLGLPYA